MLGYNNYTSPSVGCLVYFHNGVSIVLSLCMMFLRLTEILRWARVFSTWGMNADVINKLEMIWRITTRKLRMVCKCTQCKYSHVLMTIQGLYDHMMFLGSVFYVFFN